MEFKNTWTRIAARWEENKSFKDLLQWQFDNDGDLQSLFYKIEGIDTILSFFDFYKQENPNNNISKRLLKFSEVYDNNNQSLGVYLSDIFNIDYGQTDITNSYLAIDKIKTIKDYIDENEYLLNDVNSYINTLYDIINSIQVNDDIEKAQKQKVLQTIKIKGDKLIKSCNDFKMLLKTELTNFEPFYVIVNKEYNELLDDRFYPAEDEEDVMQYSSKESAQDNMRDMIEEMNEQTDEGVQKGNITILDDSDGHYTENDFEIILINNMKQYNDILKKYGIKE